MPASINPVNLKYKLTLNTVRRIVVKIQDLIYQIPANRLRSKKINLTRVFVSIRG